MLYEIKIQGYSSTTIINTDDIKQAVISILLENLSEFPGHHWSISKLKPTCRCFSKTND